MVGFGANYANDTNRNSRNRRHSRLNPFPRNFHGPPIEFADILGIQIRDFQLPRTLELLPAQRCQPSAVERDVLGSSMLNRAVFIARRPQEYNTFTAAATGSWKVGDAIHNLRRPGTGRYTAPRV